MADRFTEIGDEDDVEALLPRPDGAPRWLQQARAWVIWFGIGRLVATSLAVVGIAIGGWWLLRSPRPPTEAVLPYATTTVAATSPAQAASPTPVPNGAASSSPATGDTVGGDVTVHVAGAVARPGVYTLAHGSLVNDAVMRAGGPTRRADLDAVNLAAELVDGAQVFVPEPGESIPAVPLASAAPGAAPGAPAPPGMPTAPVDLNAATVEQLDTLPGVGPATASAIVLHREQNGPFATVDDLEAVPGIGPAKLEAVRDLVSV